MIACPYCDALNGQPCTDRRGRPPINQPGYEPTRPAVYDHWPHRKVPFNPKPADPIERRAATVELTSGHGDGA